MQLEKSTQLFQFQVPEVSLDGGVLIKKTRGQQTEKDQLVEQLMKQNLEEVSNKVRYETEAKKTQKINKS